MSDDLPPGLETLIADERAAAGPSESERARIRASIGASVGIATIAGTSATAGAASASAAAGTAAATSLVTKLVVLVAVVAAAGGAAVMLRDRVQPASVPRPPAPTRSARPAPPAPTPPATVDIVEVAVPPPVVERAAKPVIVKPPARPAGQAVAETQSETLARAWSLLSRGDANAVLVAVEQDAREHPDGALREEREALRIEALLRLERITDARDRARAFVTEFPDSVHRPAIDRALRDESDGGSAIEK